MSFYFGRPLKALKLALLGMASLERTIDRQRSWLIWIKEGDANPKLFKQWPIANGRRSKNYIPHIKHGDQIITDQQRKEEVFTEAYENFLGAAQARSHTLDLDHLGMGAVDLQELDDIFTEEEVWTVVMQLHPDRAPGPDGFIDAFY